MHTEKLEQNSPAPRQSPPPRHGFPSEAPVIHNYSSLVSLPRRISDVRILAVCSAAMLGPRGGHEPVYLGGNYYTLMTRMGNRSASGLGVRDRGERERNLEKRDVERANSRRTEREENNRENRIMNIVPLIMNKDKTKDYSKSWARDCNTVMASRVSCMQKRDQSWLIPLDCFFEYCEIYRRINKL